MTVHFLCFFFIINELKLGSSSQLITLQTKILSNFNKSFQKAWRHTKQKNNPTTNLDQEIL